jgi:hypothetical protein
MLTKEAFDKSKSKSLMTGGKKGGKYSSGRKHKVNLAEELNRFSLTIRDSN